MNTTYTSIALSICVLAGCGNTTTNQERLEIGSRTNKDTVTRTERSAITENDHLATIARRWSESVTKSMQKSPRPKTNEASISYSDVSDIFATEPTFEQIVELSKRLEFYRLETSGAKSYDADPIRIEYWKTLGDTQEQGTVRITYAFNFPSVVDLYKTFPPARNETVEPEEQEPKILQFYSFEEAAQKHEAANNGG